jgi:hypothetical protein
MHKLAITTFAFALWAAASVAPAQDAPFASAPQKGHKWLQQFVGEWEVAGEMHIDPMDPASEKMTSTGTESTRAVGNLWIVAEANCSMMGIPMNSVLTLGYDPEQQKFVGTWIDSFTSYLWNYEGTLDEENNKLTLETTGPSPTGESQHVKYRETTEFKDQDHRVFTSAFQDPDGNWITFLTMNFTRKK